MRRRTTASEPAGRGFVTSTEVARLAGVSRSAVSRTFTAGASVSPEARARVLAAAETLGYRVNRLAQSLISNRSNLVGLVGANLGSPFHASQLAWLSQALLERGMQCMLLNADTASQSIAPLIERILEFRARAIVVMSGTPPTAIVEECLRIGVRVILVNKPLPDVPADSILSDDVQGARLAADRLLAAGCRHLALIGSGSGTPSITRRTDAFRAYLHSQGIEPVLWQNGPTAYATGAAAADALLPHNRVDGAFCITDLLALGFMDAARHQHARHITRDLSIIGFDDIPQAAWRAYDLTTLQQSMPALTDAVMRAIERAPEDDEGTSTTVPVTLIERGSVRQAG